MVALSDFAWAVRPTLTNNELTQGGVMTGSAGWNAGVSSDGSSSYASWAKTTALEAITNEYTIVVVLDPNQASSDWRVLLSVPAYSSGSHVSPFHALAMLVSGTTPTALVHYGTYANSGQFHLSSAGAINTSTDGRKCYAIRRSGSAIDFVVDGVLHNSTTGVATAIDWSPSGDVTVGSRSRTSPGEGCAGTYFFVGVANRALSNSELAEITADPFNFEGIVIPRNPNVWRRSLGLR